MNTEGILIVSILIVAIIIMFWRISLLTFKVGYYEQTLKNNSEKFSHGRWMQIEKVMKMKNPFKNP